MPSPFMRALTAALLACLLCGWYVPSRAQALPPVIAPLSYGSTVDLNAGTARFSIRFDRRPDLFTVDAYGRQADSFQYWTGATARNPIEAAFGAVYGLGPADGLDVLTAVDIPATGRLTYVDVRDPGYTGPRDSGGWGQVVGRGAYRLDKDGTVSFEVPLSLLHARDGVFAYGFETYQYGAGGLADYFGVAGRTYVLAPAPLGPALFGSAPLSPVPELPAFALLAAGLPLLATRKPRPSSR